MTSLTLVTVTTSEKFVSSVEESFKADQFGRFSVVVKLLSSCDSVRVVERETGSLTIISELDDGIYDALNKALTYVSSDYYMVFGDDDEINISSVQCFFSHNVYIIKYIKPFIISGFAFNNNSKSLGRYHSVGHIISKRLHYILGPYNTNFKIAADQYLISSAHRLPRMVVSDLFGTYGGAGVSSSGWRVFIEHIFAVLLGSAKSWLLHRK